MNEHCQIVEPSAFKSEISILWENVQISVNETKKNEGSESLMQVDWVLLSEELLDNVLAAAKE